jgi:beta-lactamase superfamily II metal-dependent hydrolase
LILTHIDADHIEGLLKLVAERDSLVTFKDVWFNGRQHLEPPDTPLTSRTSVRDRARCFPSA